MRLLLHGHLHQNAAQQLDVAIGVLERTGMDEAHEVVGGERTNVFGTQGGAIEHRLWFEHSM